MIISPGNFKQNVVFPTVFCKNGSGIIPGIYEKQLVDYSLQFIKPGTNVIDIGAHSGSWTLFLAKKANKVYSFEAQRMKYYQLCGNIAINELNNVYAYNTGLGSPSQRGTTEEMMLYGIDYGSSSMTPSAIKNFKEKNVPIKDIEKIKIKCLDDYQLDNVSLIKIDVEGFELNVLKGSTNLLEKCKPIIIIEIWSDPFFRKQKEELINWIKNNNYNISQLNWSDMFICKHKNSI